MGHTYRSQIWGQQVTLVFQRKCVTVTVTVTVTITVTITVTVTVTLTITVTVTAIGVQHTRNERRRKNSLLVENDEEDVGNDDQKDDRSWITAVDEAISHPAGESQPCTAQLTPNLLSL